MLRLHGFASSNYHNVVKLVLLEKGIEFEEVTAYPPADDAYKAKNPTGKFPCLETEDGSLLGETKVMLNYLEDAYPQVPLLPADPLRRARVRELMELVDLYLELPARRLYSQALFNVAVSDEVKRSARAQLERGVVGLRDRARFEPYVAGRELTLADFGAAIHFPLISLTTKAIYGEDLLGAIPGVRRQLEVMRERPSMKRVLADRRVDVPKFAAASGVGAGEGRRWVDLFGLAEGGARDEQGSLGAQRARRRLSDGRAAPGLERRLGPDREASGLVALPREEPDLPRSVRAGLRSAARGSPRRAHGAGVGGVLRGSLCRASRGHARASARPHQHRVAR